VISSSGVPPSFDDIEVGDSFSDSVTITETHIVLAAGLFGDFAPLHVNEQYARTTRWGTRIAHGTLTTGIIAGVLSGYFRTNALGYLEESVRFTAPVYPGDTLTCRWEVLEKVRKEKLDGGVVTLEVQCFNQDDKTVLEGTAKLIVQATVSSG
jgi:3-hydroxybutyryl-CoA dehydratase